MNRILPILLLLCCDAKAQLLTNDGSSLRLIVTNRYSGPITITNYGREINVFSATTNSDPSKLVLSVSTNGRVSLSAEQINAMCADGSVCAVRGHAWGDHVHTTLEYSPGRIGCRQCSLCGAHQNLYHEWK